MKKLIAGSKRNMKKIYMENYAMTITDLDGNEIDYNKFCCNGGFPLGTVVRQKSVDCFHITTRYCDHGLADQLKCINDHISFTAPTDDYIFVVEKKKDKIIKTLFSREHLIINDAQCLYVFAVAISEIDGKLFLVVQAHDYESDTELIYKLELFEDPNDSKILHTKIGLHFNPYNDVGLKMMNELQSKFAGK